MQIVPDRKQEAMSPEQHVGVVDDCIRGVAFQLSDVKFSKAEN